MNFLERSNNSNILYFMNNITSFIENTTSLSFSCEKTFNVKYCALLDLRENLDCLLKDEKSNLVNNSKELLFKHFLEGLKYIQIIKEFNMINKFNNIQMPKLFSSNNISNNIYIFLRLFLTTYLDIYKLLFKYGLDPNQQDEDGKTILIHLCQNIKNSSILTESLILVLQFNPEKDIHDYFGHNAIDYFMKNFENNAIRNDRPNSLFGMSNNKIHNYRINNGNDANDEINIILNILNI